MNSERGAGTFAFGGSSRSRLKSSAIRVAEQLGVVGLPVQVIIPGGSRENELHSLSSRSVPFPASRD